jgi:hypothetical protein
VPVPGENHHLLDPWELFQCRCNFRCHTRIRTDPRREKAPAEFHYKHSRQKQRAYMNLTLQESRIDDDEKRLLNMDCYVGDLS